MKSVHLILLIAMTAFILTSREGISQQSGNINAGLSPESGNIKLPEPAKEGGKPLMNCLNERHSSREFSDKEIPLQMLSDLLWAGYGINREGDGKHTIPTSMNRQNMELYAIIPQGVYRYNEKANELELIQAGNHMSAAGKQDFVGTSKLNIIVVSDMEKLGDGSPEVKAMTAGIHAGSIIQNIYLYCASAGLNAVVRAWFDQEALAGTLRLTGNKQVILAQTIGFAKG